MDSKNKRSKIICSLIKDCLKLILARIWLIKLEVKEFVYNHIVSIFIICILLILLMVNVNIRNQRIEELEIKVNELEIVINDNAPNDILTEDK